MNSFAETALSYWIFWLELHSYRLWLKQTKWKKLYDRLNTFVAVRDFVLGGFLWEPQDQHYFWSNTPFSLQDWLRIIVPFLANGKGGVPVVHRESTDWWGEGRSRSADLFHTAVLINVSELHTLQRFTEYLFPFFLRPHTPVGTYWLIVTVLMQEFGWKVPSQVLWRKVDRLHLYKLHVKLCLCWNHWTKWSCSGIGISNCASELFGFWFSSSYMGGKMFCEPLDRSSFVVEHISKT